MPESIIKHAQELMAKSMENLHRELAGVRTGKANPQLLDSIKVENAAS